MLRKRLHLVCDDGEAAPRFAGLAASISALVASSRIMRTIFELLSL